MTPTPKSQDPTTTIPYTPLPPKPTSQNVIILHHYHTPHTTATTQVRRCLLISAGVLLLLSAAYLLYPSDPVLQLSRIHLNRVRVQTQPHLSLDLSFSVLIKVYNRDFYSLDYNDLGVSVGYRGRELGFVSSRGGHVRARTTSYVNASVVVDGFQVVHDVFYLIEDLAKGSIPFDAETEVRGKLGLLFFEIPLKARVSCEVLVNVDNQTIIRQDCYPE